MQEYSEYLVDSIMVGRPKKVLQGIGVRHFILHFIVLNNDAVLGLFDSKVITKI